MDLDEFRVIPGYEAYCVNATGVIKSNKTGVILKEYLLDGYRIVDTFYGSLTETLPVHRAVALTWVENTDPEKYTIVNHLDGNPTNNWYLNLEWTDYSGNNLHAINTGLRHDNIKCRVRDFYTREIFMFSSLAQAAESMGLRKDTSIKVLRPKKYGALVKGRYEVREEFDPEPWFYENRDLLTCPARFMVIVHNGDGSEEEYFTGRSLLKTFQLYGAPSKSIPDLVHYANKKFPDKQFVLHDSFTKDIYRTKRTVKPIRKLTIVASNLDKRTEYSSLTQCARSFGVDRSTILNRLRLKTDFNGWTFTQF